VFSPYYKRAGRRDPLEHCAINVALYGKGGHKWAMTERGRAAVSRSATHFRVGPSAIVFEDGTLTLRLDEQTAPIPSAIRGTVRLTPRALNRRAFALDPSGRHHWWPIAPSARIEVDLDEPGLTWSGSGYLDHNHGSEPLEAGFRSWDWSRASLTDGAAILYDTICRDGAATNLALHVSTTGEVTELVPPAQARLPSTFWRLARGTRVDAGTRPRLHTTLEDTPFYARSLIGAELFGEHVIAMHESLSLDRFASPVVQFMLPFRMPRRAG
jgi:carotenoid 1,2-hydratase